MVTVESGSGGLSQVAWANGFRVTHELSLGLKASYVFGSTISDYANQLIVSNQSVPFVVAIREQTYMKDFMFTGGLAFAKDSLFNDNIRVNFGLTYAFATKLNTNKTTVVQRRLTSQTPITSDTLVSGKGTVNIPSALTVGFALNKGVDWAIATEFSMQDWSKFESINAEDEGLEKSWRVSLGGEITPDQTAFKNYFKRVTYRLGGSFEKTPYAVYGKQLNDYGVNFGFSLPAGRSSIDTAVRLGKRGDKSETTVEETYFKIYFGITFVDQWFHRRKID
jgi:long-subunit fatty acid transport protein